MTFFTSHRRNTPAESPRRHAGFTQLELVVVLVLLSILSYVALPSLSTGSAMQAAAFRDEVTAALRYAQKIAVSHRRLVCAAFTSTTVTLTIAQNNGDTVCTTTALTSTDNNSAYARSADAANASLTITPPGPMYFQPSGNVTRDGTGNTVADYTLTISDLPAVSVVGATGYVN